MRAVLAVCALVWLAGAPPTALAASSTSCSQRAVGDRSSSPSAPRLARHARGCGALLRAARGGARRRKEPDAEEREEMALSEAAELKALGNALVKSADFVGAAAKYSEAIAMLAYDGDGGERVAELDRRCRLNLASCAIRTGDLDEAIEQCTAILSLAPGCAKALAKRAQAREANGELQDAIDDYRSAAESAPPAEAARLSERADLLAQLAAGAAGGGANPFGGGGAGGGGMGALSDLLGMGGGGLGGGGLGGLAALADSGLLPPSMKRLLGALQFALKVRAAVAGALKAIEPYRPLLLAALLLLPALRFLWTRVLAGALGLSGGGAPRAGGALAPLKATPRVAVAGLYAVRRTDLFIAAEAQKRLANYVLLLSAVLLRRRSASRK